MEKNVYVIEDDAITSLKKDFAFLSNMYSYKVEIEYNGYKYNSVETAYHAQKDLSQTERFAKLTNPYFARSKGKSIKNLRKDWDEVKDKIMEELVYIKFSSNERLKNKLLSTGNRQIVEGNNWGDTYWGVCNGIGLNKLGEILMRVREKIK